MTQTEVDSSSSEQGRGVPWEHGKEPSVTMETARFFDVDFVYVKGFL
jgi:hypothetical protein